MLCITQIVQCSLRCDHQNGWIDDGQDERYDDLCQEDGLGTRDNIIPIPVKLSPHDFQSWNCVSGDPANNKVDHQQ